MSERLSPFGKLSKEQGQTLTRVKIEAESILKLNIKDKQKLTMIRNIQSRLQEKGINPDLL